jgi:hypothetical protein
MGENSPNNNSTKGENSPNLATLFPSDKMALKLTTVC